MTEKDKRRNPFEDHIESDSFDLSQLEHRSQETLLRVILHQYLQRLPQPLNTRISADYLDAQQRELCHALSDELVKAFLRQHFGDELKELSDDELHYLLLTPIALGMLIQQHLYHAEEPIEDENDEALARWLLDWSANRQSYTLHPSSSPLFRNLFPLTKPPHAAVPPSPPLPWWQRLWQRLRQWWRKPNLKT